MASSTPPRFLKANLRGEGAADAKTHPPKHEPDSRGYGNQAKLNKFVLGSGCSIRLSQYFEAGQRLRSASKCCAFRHCQGSMAPPACKGTCCSLDGLASR
jgi:hypothetical protein